MSRGAPVPYACTPVRPYAPPCPRRGRRHIAAGTPRPLQEGPMRATRDLIAEHDAVLDALRLLGHVADALGRGRSDAQGHLEELLEFLRGFVDRCHHGKEEDVLFPELERRGVGREDGPIGVMLAEHEAGRGHVRALSGGLDRLQQGEAAATTTIREHARAYPDLLRSHILKENNILFPMADR